MLRKLFLLLIALWLPVQAGAALASSLATGTAPHPAVHDQAGMVHNHEGNQHPVVARVGADAGVQDHGHQHGTPGSGCERCGLCQFVHGGVMLNADTGLPAIVVLPVFLPFGDERFTAHIPELLQRPPLSAA